MQTTDKDQIKHGGLEEEEEDETEFSRAKPDKFITTIFDRLRRGLRRCTHYLRAEILREPSHTQWQCENQNAQAFQP